MYLRGAVATFAVALCCVGCTSSAVQGRGQVHVPPSSHHPDFPTSSVIASPSPTAPPATTAPTTTAAPPTRADRIRGLVAQTNGAAHAVVTVPHDGYEAATWDQSGGIQFWRNAAGTVQWQEVGQSRYPYVPALGPPQARVVGAHLRGMQHATFIVRGVFTGDGSGNAVAFTTGPNGWGAIKAEPNGNIGPSGAPVGHNLIGLSFDFGFSDGYLVTEDCPTNRPIADCGRYPITKRWAWEGQDFRQVQ